MQKVALFKVGDVGDFCPNRRPWRGGCVFAHKPPAQTAVFLSAPQGRARVEQGVAFDVRHRQRFVWHNESEKFDDIDFKTHRLWRRGRLLPDLGVLAGETRL